MPWEAAEFEHPIFGDDARPITVRARQQAAGLGLDCFLRQQISPGPREQLRAVNALPSKRRHHRNSRSSTSVVTAETGNPFSQTSIPLAAFGVDLSLLRGIRLRFDHIKSSIIYINAVGLGRK